MLTSWLSVYSLTDWSTPTLL